MPNLHRSQVHVDAVLTNVSRTFAKPALKAELLAPVVNVLKESDVYYLFGREELRDLRGRDLRADKSEATLFSWKPEGVEPYLCHERALKDCVSDRMVANSDSPVRVRARTAEKLTYALRLQYEIRVSDALTDTATFATTTAPLPWDDPGADIEADVKEAKEAIRLRIGVNPTTIVLSVSVANAVVDFLKASSEISINERSQLYEMPSRWLGMDVVVMESVKNTAAEGATEVLVDVWPLFAGLYWINSRTPALDDMSVMWTIRARGFSVKSWRDDEIDAAWIQPSWIQTEKIVAAAAGQLITLAADGDLVS